MTSAVGSVWYAGAYRTPEGIENVKAGQRDRQKKYSARLAAIKLERGCIDCGYNEHPAALDFDHRDPKTKSFQISVYRSWKSVEREIEKCDVRCSNCHRIRTHSH